MATINKLKLDFDIDLKIIGLFSNAEDYKLCWHLNNSLKWQMKRTDNLPPIKSSSQNGLFSLSEINDDDDGHTMFSYIDEDTFIDNYLISNFSSSGYLIPEFKQCNFFIFFKGEIITNEELVDLLEMVQSIEVISSAFIINTKQIKDISNILF